MTLITRQQFQGLLANGRAAQEARRQGTDIDPHPVVKLFTPDASCTWLLTEVDPDDPDRAFGLDDLGQGFPELGYVSLREIKSLRGNLGLTVERDRYFTADKPLSAFAEEARRHRRIVA
jgi:hypothetical protein